MRAARFLLLALGSVLVLLLAAAWLIPERLDWTRYRSSIEAIAGRTLGRPVRIEGKIALTVLPEPVLTADGVDIAEGGGGISLRVAGLRLRVALAPLVRGRIEPRELVLHEPVLALPWPLPESAALRTPDWFETFSARIEDGRLSLGSVEISGIDAVFSGVETGAMAIAGAARTAPLDWRFTARLTAPGGDGAQGLDIAIDGQGKATGLGATFTGQIEPDGTLGGHIAGRGRDLSLLFPAPHLAFRGEGRLAASSGLAALEDLDLDFGGEPIRGAVAFRMRPAQRLDVALAAGQLDVNQWLPTLGALGPARLPMGLDLSAEAAGLAGGTLRRVRVAVDADGREFRVRDASALLPGEARLHVSGRVDAEDRAQPHFTGRFALDAPDFRTSLRWIDAALGLGLSGLPPDALRTVSLEGAVMAAAGSIELGGLSGRIDGPSVAGRLGLHFGERPIIAVDLDFANLALDAWLPTKLPTVAAMPRLFAGELKLRAARATLHEASVSGFTLDATSRDGALTLHTLDGAIYDARLHAAGTVTEDGRIADASLELSAPDASAVAPLLPASWRVSPKLLKGPIAARVTADGPPQSLALQVGVDLDDGRLEAAPVIDLASRSWSGPVTLRHPGAVRLLADAGLLSNADWFGEGSLSLSGQFAGAPGRVAGEDFDVVAGGLRARGQVAVDGTGPVPAISGRLDADTLPLPVVSLADTAPLPLDRLAGLRANLQVHAGSATADGEDVAQDVSGTLALDDGKLRIERFSARVRGGRVQGTMTLDSAAATPTLELDASLADLTLTGNPIEGRFAGTARLHADGYSPATIAATASGSLVLSMQGGTLSGIDMSAVQSGVKAARAGDLARAQAALGAALSGGATRFDTFSIDGELAHGLLGIADGKLTSPDGSIDLAGTVSVPSLALDLRAAIRPAVPDGPEIGLRLGGTADAPVRTPELGGLARWLLDHPPG